MRTNFLNRKVFDYNTQTWKFSDGSGVIPDEMRIDLQLAQEQKTKYGTNGVFVPSTLFRWKDRLLKLRKK